MITSFTDAIQEVVYELILKPLFKGISQTFEKAFPKAYSKLVRGNEKAEKVTFAYAYPLFISGVLPALMGGTGGNIIFCSPVILFQVAMDCRSWPKERHPNKAISFLVRAIAVAVPVILAFYLGHSHPDLMTAWAGKVPDSHH